MVIVSVTCWIEGWSAKLDVGSAHEAERHLTVNARLYDRDRFKFGGTDVNSAGGYIRRKHERQDTAFRKALGMEPDRTYDVAPGELRPIGAVCKIDDHLDFELFPGETVFDELWARSTYGGTMPSTFRIGIRGEGETWQNSIVWDTQRQPKLPIMSVSFSVNHSLPPHPTFRPLLEDEKGEA